MNTVVSALFEHHEPQAYLPIIVRIAALGVFVSTLELVRRPELLRVGGMMSWRVSRLDNPHYTTGAVAAGLDLVLAYPAVMGLMWLRLGLAAFMVAAPGQVILSPAVMLPMALLTLSVPVRTRFGLNGADQIDLLVFGGLAMVTFHLNDVTASAFLVFLAAQCILAYTVAGVAKLVSPGWREGSHLAQILNIRMYCHEGSARMARAHPGLVRLGAWGVILWESLFWLVLVLPIQLSVPMIAAGLLFHVVIAFVMGLNDFVWAFAATYPALLFCLTLRPW